MEVINRISNFIEWTETFCDPRTIDWPLVRSPWPILALISLYILFTCWLGPKIMERYSAFDMRMLLVFYNAAMTFLNFYIFKELILGGINAGYSFPCEPFSLPDDPKHIRIASAIWWYFISKPLEFLDTIFFVLRKKNSQITFLHVYHHSTMVFFWWIGVKWVAGGLTIYPPIYNSFIHVIMYSYYGLAAFGPKYQKYLWWKKYLTQLQLIQFCLAMGHSIYTAYTGCPFIYWMYHMLNLYMISFLILFGNFYMQAYIKKKRATKEERHLKDKCDQKMANGHAEHKKLD